MDIHERVTARILEQLEKGVIPWRKTWHGSQPINYVSRKAYRGVNLLLLPFGGEWLTFKQAQDAGGRVKKGEKASMIVFYKMMEREDENGKKTTFPFSTKMVRSGTILRLFTRYQATKLFRWEHCLSLFHRRVIRDGYVAWQLPRIST